MALLHGAPPDQGRRRVMLKDGSLSSLKPMLLKEGDSIMLPCRRSPECVWRWHRLRLLKAHAHHSYLCVVCFVWSYTTTTTVVKQTAGGHSGFELNHWYWQRRRKTFQAVPLAQPGIQCSITTAQQASSLCMSFPVRSDVRSQCCCSSTSWPPTTTGSLWRGCTSTASSSWPSCPTQSTSGGWLSSVGVRRERPPRQRDSSILTVK